MEIIVLLVLTIINGLFSLSEIALVSANKQRIEHKAHKGDKNAKIILALLEKPEDFLSSIQVGITLIGIVSGVYGGATLVDDVEPVIAGITWAAPYAHEIAYVIIVALITYFSIVIGELLPKTIGMRSPEKVALIVAPAVKFFSKATFPFVKVLTISTRIFNRITGIKDRNADAMSEEELRFILKTASNQGVLEKEENDLHQNVFSFSTQKAKTLMTHRKEVEWINLQHNMVNIDETIFKSDHSKFPVCDGDIDHIKGYITVKDYFNHRDNPGFKMEEIIKEVVFIHENMYSIDILKEFKQRKQYMGVVVDEYGAFEGIITLQDLVEAIIGDLPESDDTEDPEIIERNDGSYLVSGAVTIRDLNTYFDRTYIEPDDDQYSTLAGFIISHLQKIPETGERFVFNHKEIEIIDKDFNRIDKVLIIDLPEDEEEE